MALLDKLFKKDTAPDIALKERVAKLLKTSPEALESFEREYAVKALNVEGDDVFHTNSRQAAEKRRRVDGDAVAPKGKLSAEEETAALEKAKSMTEQIVEELLAQTSVYSFDGNLTQKVTRPMPSLPDGRKAIVQKDISSLPPAMRPQLTGDMAAMDFGMVDNGVGASMMLLDMYADALDPKKTAKQREGAYGRFRQGLDIMDIDPIMYKMLGQNKNSMGYWLPKLVDACTGQDFFRIPATKIATVPITLLQMTRLEYEHLSPVTLAIIDKWAMRAFELDVHKDYFIKTGTYSSKFDFRNAKVVGEKEVRELGEYLTYIQYQASMMAGPLTMPAPILGVSTTNEYVVREFIPDKENAPCIYKGLPLHTEYRVFIDCDTKEVLGIHPYWDQEGMKKRFGHEPDANSPHNIHDYTIFAMYEETLMARYEANRDKVAAAVKAILPGLDLPGQWSLDVMQNGDDFWLIDMALAEQSTFYTEEVPLEKRRPMDEQWLPNLSPIPFCQGIGALPTAEKEE